MTYIVSFLQEAFENDYAYQIFFDIRIIYNKKIIECTEVMIGGKIELCTARMIFHKVRKRNLNLAIFEIIYIVRVEGIK